MRHLEIQYEQIDKEVSLYVFELTKYNKSDELDYFFSLLNKEEYNKIQNISTVKKQIEKVIQRGILKELLGTTANIQPDRILIGKTDKGKPFLINKNIPFNYSHSGNYFMTALAKSGEVGVDIQVPRTLKYGYPLLVFSSEEKRLYEQLPTLSKKKKFFYQVWTSKEAFVKATGDGITVNLDEIDLWKSEGLLKEKYINYQGKKHRLYAQSIQKKEYYFTYVHMQKMK